MVKRAARKRRPGKVENDRSQDQKNLAMSRDGIGTTRCCSRNA